MSRRKLINNSSWTLLGFAVPAIVAVPSIAVLSRILGVEKFSLYLILIFIVGYTSIIDLGISRAIVRFVSQQRNDRKEALLGVSTSIVILSALGLAASAAIYISAESILNYLKVTPGNLADAKLSLRTLTLIVPIVLINQSLYGWLEGHEYFKQLAGVRAVSGTLVAGLPAVLCYTFGTLISAMAGIFAARFITFIILLALARIDEIFERPIFCRATFYKLFAFGGWITVSNVISPLLTYFDRVLLSSLTNAYDAGFYTAPSEAIAKLNVLPHSIARVYFSMVSKKQPAESQISLSRHAYVLTFILVAPLTAIVFLNAEVILTTWLGENYTGVSVEVMQILCVGFCFNAMAQIPYAEIQAKGHSKVTAIVHLIEILPYITLLTYLIYEFGVLGAAFAWLTRNTIDFFVLFSISRGKKYAE